jgi:hypothetical protein
MQITSAARGEHSCSICKDILPDINHDARPVNAGRCCDVCKDTVVNPLLDSIIAAYLK